jgi:hypothetical protein
MSIMPYETSRRISGEKYSEVQQLIQDKGMPPAFARY